MNTLLVGATTQAEDIRDIRGPVAMPSPLPWLLLVALALALLLVAIGLKRLVRAWRQRSPSAYERAKARLREVSEQAPSERGDWLAEQVSDTVREYVESRFAIRATHRTTEEFLLELLVRADTQLSSYQADLERFLGACDQAKFTGRGLPEAQKRELCSEALTFVEAAESSLRERCST